MSSDFLARAALRTLAFLAIFWPASALADPAPQPTATPVGEIGRVSTSDRHDEPIERTTRSTYVVDRARIDAYGRRTIADAVADVPGVEVYRYGAFGSQSAVFMRGASSTGVLVLLDGLPMTPGSNQQIDLGTFSTVGVRRIEVVEGSGATLYGSNAVGGVINIITDVPRATYLEAAAGTLDDRDLRVSAGNGRVGVSFERHIAANGYSYPALPVPGATPIPAGSRVNADAEQTAARISYDTNLGSTITARFRLGSDESHLGVPGSLLYGATPFARQNVSRNDIHLDIAHTGAHSATTVTLFGLNQNLDYVDPSSATENPTLDGRVQLSVRDVVEGGPSTLTAGIDLARESAELANIAQYDAAGNVNGYATIGQTQSEAALYVQEQYTLGGVLMNAGLRAENDAPLGGAATPSLGFGLPLGSQLRLLINAGTAFRVPTIIDRYYPGYANPNLRPERSQEGDITLQSSALLGGATLGIWARNSSNLIQLNSAYVPENIAQARLRGIVATLKTRPYHDFVATLSSTDTFLAENLSPGAPVSRLDFTPVFVTKIGLERSFGNGAYALGAQADLLGPHFENAGFNADGQRTVDAFVRVRVAHEAIVSLRAQNIANVHYQPVFGYPAPGRTFVVELSTR